MTPFLFRICKNQGRDESVFRSIMCALNAWFRFTICCLFRKQGVSKATGILGANPVENRDQISDFLTLKNKKSEQNVQFFRTQPLIYSCRPPAGEIRVCIAKQDMVKNKNSRLSLGGLIREIICYFVTCL